MCSAASALGHFAQGPAACLLALADAGVLGPADEAVCNAAGTFALDAAVELAVGRASPKASVDVLAARIRQVNPSLDPERLSAAIRAAAGSTPACKGIVVP